MTKKTFIAYTDRYLYCDWMSAEEKANLFDCIRSYATACDSIEPLPTIKFVRNKIKKQIDENWEQYDKVCKKNAENAKKRREKAQSSGSKPANATACDRMPNMLDNENDTDSDNKKDIEIVSNDTTPDGVFWQAPLNQEDFEEETPIDPKKKEPPKKEKSSAKKEKKVTVAEWEGGELVYGNPDINDILEKIENYCKLYGVVYAPAPNERNAAQWLLSKKFEKHAQSFNMTLDKFIENIIKIWAKLQYWKWAYNAPSIYYNRWEIVDKGRKERLKKAEEESKAQWKIKPSIRTS